MNEIVDKEEVKSNEIDEASFVKNPPGKVFKSESPDQLPLELKESLGPVASETAPRT